LKLKSELWNFEKFQKNYFSYTPVQEVYNSKNTSAQDLRSHKINMLQPVWQFLHAKTYSNNISLSISIAHQLIDTSKFIVCHFHYIMCKKLLNEKKFGIWTCISSMNSYYATTYTKIQNHHIKSITGHKKLKKLDNFIIG